MKVLSKLFLLFYISLFFDYVSVQAVIISPEDIALQDIWESPTATTWQKFKIFLHDIKAKFPFNDAQSPRRAYLDFQPTCARTDNTKQDRAICRIIRNQNYFGFGLIIGIPIAISFRSVLAAIGHLKERRQRQNYIYVPPTSISVPPLLRAKMTYLDQNRDMFNPFEILNIKENATRDDVKSAYKKLSVRYHPDKHQGDAKDIYDEIFKIIGQARESADWIIDFTEPQKTPPQQKKPSSYVPTVSRIGQQKSLLLREK